MEFCPSAVEWGNAADWAQVVVGFLAAVATVVAVWVALSSSRREHARTLQLRDDEWQRADSVSAQRAAVWAHTFNREIMQAAVPLAIYVKELKRLLSAGLAATAIALLKDGIDTQGHLSMVERMADRLDDLPPEQSVALLNLLSAWRRVTAPLPSDLANLSVRQREDFVLQRIHEYTTLYGLIGELQDMFRETSRRLPFVKDVSANDLQRHAEESRANLRHQLGLSSNDPEVGPA